jgi:hypothetical protein
MQGDKEEVPPQLEVGFNPQIPFAQRDEGHDVLDPIRVQVLQLDPVVVQQSPEEWMGRNHESALVEGREGHDVAIEQRQHFLATGHEPLRRLGSHTEKTTLDEALHMRMGDIKAIARLHGKQGQGNENFANGGRARAENLSVCGGGVERTRLQLGISKTKGKTPSYRGRWSERQTVLLDQRAYHVPSLCLFESREHATPGRLFEGCAERRFALKGRKPPQVRRDTGLKTLPRPVKAQEIEGWPTDGFTTTPRHR